MLSVIISSGLFSVPLVNVLEWKVVDSWIEKTRETVPENNVAVIGLDEEFLEQFPWPLEKNLYGELLYYLNEMGARVVGIDVLFSHNTNRCNTEGNELFHSMLKLYHNTVLIYSPFAMEDGKKIQKSAIPEQYSIGKGTIPGFNIQTAVLPYRELLESGAYLAHHNLSPPFNDGTYRALPAFVSSAGLLYPSLSVSSVSLYLDSAEVKWDPENLIMSIGQELSIFLDAGSEFLLDFKYDIPFYRMTDIFHSLQAYMSDEVPAIGKDQLNGRIILIGASDPLLGDNALSPLAQDGLTPKVRLHASAAATLIHNSGIRNLGRTGAISFSIILMLILLVIFKIGKVKYCYLAMLALVISTYLGGQSLYNNGILIPIVEGWGAGLIFTLLASLVLFLEKDLDRSFLFDSFKTYLSEDVIDDMYKNHIRPRLGGQEGIRTAFFTDIQSFSTFSEKIGSPTKLVELLNEYLSAMTDILLECQGTLDKYEGDAIIAFFGAPMEMPDHASKACEAAVKMQAKLAELRAKWKSEGDKWPEIVHNMRMRIGINSGPIVTGNMGSHVRMNYTMMGDAVNLAARLESGAKQYGVYTLISGETMSLVEETVLARKIDVIRVIGKSEPVEIYEILCSRENMDSKSEKLAELFENGRLQYQEQNWDEAVKCFEECLELEPHHPDREIGCSKTPSHVYINRCKQYKINPPENDWDGVYTATQK